MLLGGFPTSSPSSFARPLFRPLMPVGLRPAGILFAARSQPRRRIPHTPAEGTNANAPELYLADPRSADRGRLPPDRSAPARSEECPPAFPQADPADRRQRPGFRLQRPDPGR